MGFYQTCFRWYIFVFVFALAVRKLGLVLIAVRTLEFRGEGEEMVELGIRRREYGMQVKLRYRSLI